jgi:hypothetical protein
VSPQCGDHRTCPCGGLSVWVGDCWRCSGQNPRDVAGWRERALAAEARVRDLEETVGEALGQSDYWYELWRKAANAVMRLDAELNG